MALVDRYGREIRNNRPIREEIAVSSIRSDFSSYVADGLTPGTLAALLRDADMGNVVRQADLFEAMEEKDAHLASVLQTRRLGVSGLPWTVHPASDAARDVDIAAFVRDTLERTTPDAGRHDYDDLSFSDAVLDVLDALGKGFSVCEIMWELSEGHHVPTKIIWKHPRQFTFWDAGQRVLRVPRLLTEAAPTTGEDLIPGKFIYHRARSRSGLAPRGGVLRPCTWSYLFKNYGIKDWVIFGERYAMPMRVGTYPAGASETERDVLERAVRYLGADAAAIMSEGMKIEFLGADAKSTSSDFYERMAQYCDAAMSKAVLGQTLTTEQTGGTYATGTIHQQVRDDILAADARSLGECLTSQLVAPIVLYNYGAGTKVPRLMFTIEDEEDYTSNVARLEGAQKIGLPVPLTQAYEMLGLRQPEDGEAVLSAAAPAAAPVIAAKAQQSYAPCSCGRAHSATPAEVLAMKADALDPGEPDWFADYMGALAPQLKGMTAASLDAVAEYVRGLDAPPPVDEFSRAVAGLVAAEFAKIDPAPIRKTVEDMYRWHRLTNRLAPAAEISWGGADVRSADALARFDRFYVSKWAGNPGVESAIKSHFEQRFINEGAGIFGSDPAAIAELKRKFATTLGQLTDGQVQRIVDTSVMRTRNWGRVAQMHDAGVAEVEIWEPRQDCAFCAEMHGRRISVTRAYRRVELMSAMEASEFEAELKAWPTSEQGLLNDPAIIERAQAAGLVPPFHPHCYGITRVVIS